MQGDQGNRISRTSPETGKMSRTLSALVVTTDDELVTYRQRRVAEPNVDIELLRQARDLLDLVGLAITQGGPERWNKIRAAHAALAPPLVGADSTVTMDDAEAAALRQGISALPFQGETQSPASASSSGSAGSNAPPHLPPPYQNQSTEYDQDQPSSGGTVALEGNAAELLRGNVPLPPGYRKPDGED